MKRNLITVVVVLLLCVLAVGFYRGWFVLSSNGPDAASSKVNINLSVDPDKVKADADVVTEKAKELTHNTAEGAKELGEKLKVQN